MNLLKKIIAKFTRTNKERTSPFIQEVNESKSMYNDQLHMYKGFVYFIKNPDEEI